ncbi:putative GPI anchored protein [Aspergillus novofumigatus IBT 16806]|uniref:GPI anchored protein n=1 Tax=Aspergillus novofumigatus (strain IBT 16806) TaxID=1392255 RepID=A0A2I1BYR5_ASPN1|nr:uncharacterized protein P174DRAFT_377655 [Aspergillus novofumigatus IBT 16806]PKX90491.1 hypothetical protein P174DRAFT_377655 [Aspergillus novofumigatus IBT 16806]
MLASQLLLSLAAAGLVSAQNTVTSMLIYGADPQPLVASIVGSDATATTYSINCPPGTDSSDCGMGPGLTLVAGPTTTVLKMDEPGEDFHWTVSCSVGGTTTAVCTETASGAAANFPGVSSLTFSSDLPLMAVTITAGSGAGAGATPVTASATPTTSASATASGKSTASEDAGKPSSTGSSAVSTGGMPRVTGGAGGLFGAAAVALGVFAL